ncbi:MAG TPA: hypothetical protein VMJ11_04700 [Paraburkholderia sp.]|uniref:hypothetical protein n=1 Tax=Paraburkholderia sp. TaxID=1926495 RepID=UPI002C3C8505|nr:hypothetical protein [Paraburkholderia sp.]HTR05955.1 hypothetical protein [Paraburkholderia sp.]
MGILSWLKRRRQAPEADAAIDSAQVREGLERVVRLSPQLRLAAGYERRLLHGVRVSLRYLDELIGELPPACEASGKAWSTDAWIHAFFAAPDEVAQALSRSEDLRRFFHEHPGADEAFAVLGMAMEERRTLGAQQHGEMVRTDAVRATLSFSDYQVRMCGLTETELRREIELRMLEQLALEGISRMAGSAARRDALEQERALLKTRLQLLERQGVGLGEVVGGEATVDAAGRERLKAQIAENARHLAKLGMRSEALQQELEQIGEVLDNPAAHMDVTVRHVRLDAMNVIVDDSSPTPAHTIDLRVARIPALSGRLRAFALVRFARRDLLPVPSVLDQASRPLI